jgi:hypothetical protein
MMKVTIEREPHHRLKGRSLYHIRVGDGRMCSNLDTRKKAREMRAIYVNIQRQQESK